MVTLTYDLRVDDENGEVVEQATEEQPLQFLYGSGAMLPKFESHLAGLREGEPFTVRLSKNDAYGDLNEEAIVELPKQVYLVDGKFDGELISVGNTVPMMSSNGQRLNGLVLDISDEGIKMDFNHPLAGEDLFFSGKVKVSPVAPKLFLSIKMKVQRRVRNSTKACVRKTPVSTKLIGRNWYSPVRGLHRKMRAMMPR